MHLAFAIKLCCWRRGPLAVPYTGSLHPSCKTSRCLLPNFTGGPTWLGLGPWRELLPAPIPSQDTALEGNQETETTRHTECTYGLWAALRLRTRHGGRTRLKRRGAHAGLLLLLHRLSRAARTAVPPLRSESCVEQLT